MSLPAPKVQRSFADVVFAAGELFPPGDCYRVFREKVLPVLRKARPRLARLYCADNGRPAIEPVVVLGATALQFMEKLPDRLAAAAVRLNLGWKYAMDMEVDAKGFDASSLSTFRTRLAEHGEERLVFDAILDGLRDAGLVRRKARQRLDSTHVLGLVCAMSRLDVGSGGVASSNVNYPPVRSGGVGSRHASGVSLRPSIPSPPFPCFSLAAVGPGTTRGTRVATRLSTIVRRRDSRKTG